LRGIGPRLGAIRDILRRCLLVIADLLVGVIADFLVGVIVDFLVGVIFGILIIVSLNLIRL
jgi:hypothetical protein